jgi:regulator of sigma E protease
MGVLEPIITIVLFFLILGTLVVIHELGHFVAARMAGVRVLEFGIGFPPRAKVIGLGGVHPDDAAQYETDVAAAKSRRTVDPDTYEALLETGPPRTVYTLNWLPIGGFVKLEGEDGDRANHPRAFSSKSLPVRLLILVSGVVMNVLLAFVIFAGILWLASPLAGVKIPLVDPGSPAAEAGLKPGDSILAVDGQRFQLLIGPSVFEVLRSRAGENVTLTIDDPAGVRRDVSVTLRDEAAVAAGQGALGIRSTDEQPFESYFDGATTTNDLGVAVRIGAEETVRWMGLIVGGLGMLVSSVAADPTAPPPVSGPIGIATQIGDVFFNAGPILTLFVAGILSANLAVVNILPFPPLDGGRMLMITLKRIFGSRISVRAEQLTYLVGFVFLFAFIIWVSGFDLIRTLSGGAPPTP